MRTLIVMPTYNESPNLEGVVERTLDLGIEGLAVLVVDDASPDGTGAIADRLHDRHPESVFVMHRKGKSGLGSAYLDGFRYGLRNGYDLLCEMDADGSHDPASVPDLIGEARLGADVVIGSRRIPGGKIIGWAPHRHIMSGGAMFMSRLLLRLKTRDVTAGFRCYRASAIEELLKLPIKSDGYAFQEEMIFYCERLGFRIKEVPITFRDREKGESKLSWKEVVRFFTAIFRLMKIRPQRQLDDDPDTRH